MEHSNLTPYLPAGDYNAMSRQDRQRQRDGGHGHFDMDYPPPLGRRPPRIAGGRLAHAVAPAAAVRTPSATTVPAATAATAATTAAAAAAAEASAGSQRRTHDRNAP